MKSWDEMKKEHGLDFSDREKEEKKPSSQQKEPSKSSSLGVTSSHANLAKSLDNYGKNLDEASPYSYFNSQKVLDLRTGTTRPSMATAGGRVKWAGLSNHLDKKKEAEKKTALSSDEKDELWKDAATVISKEEIAIFNTLKEAGYEKEAEAYMNEVMPSVYEREMGNLLDDIDEAGKGENLLNYLITGKVVGLTGVSTAMAEAKGEQLDPNSGGYQLAAVREKTREKLLEGLEHQELGSIALSGLDFLTSLGFGKVAALTMLGGMAGGETTHGVIQRGGTQKQAIAEGGIAFAIEAATEAIPLGRLFKLVKPVKEAGVKGVVRLVKNFDKAKLPKLIKDILIQAGMEGSQELVTEYTNTLADIAIMGEKSNYELYKSQLQTTGMSEQEAEKEANKMFFVIQPAKAFGGGALLGGTLGGGASAIGTIRTNQFNKKYGNMLGNNTQTEQLEQRYQAEKNLAGKGLLPQNQNSNNALQDLGRKQTQEWWDKTPGGLDEEMKAGEYLSEQEYLADKALAEKGQLTSNENSNNALRDFLNGQTEQWWDETLATRDAKDANLGYKDWWGKKVNEIPPSEHEIISMFNEWRRKAFDGSFGNVNEGDMGALIELYKEETGIDLKREISAARQANIGTQTQVNSPAAKPIQQPPLVKSTTPPAPPNNSINALANTAYNQLFGKGKTITQEKVEQPQKPLKDTTDYSGVGLNELTAISKGKSMVASPKKTETLKGKVGDTINSFQRKFTDDAESFMKLGKAVGDPQLYNRMNHARQSRGMAQFMIGSKGTYGKQHGGQRSFADPTKVVGKSLTEIWDSVRKKGDGYYRDFQDYLRNYHNIDRMAQKKPVFGKDHSAEKSAVIVLKYEAQHPEFKQKAEEVWGYSRNLLQTEVDSGIISQEDMDTLVAMYPHYVTTKRNKPKNKLGGNKPWAKGTIQKATGVFEDAVDAPEMLDIENEMVKQTQRVLSAANANMAGRQLLDIAVEHSGNPEVNSRVRLVKTEDAPKNRLDLDMEQQATEFDPEGNLVVYRDGKKYTLEVDKGLAYGLKAFEPKAYEDNMVLQGLEKTMTAFKKLVTSYSPTFLVRNPIRDMQDAGLYSKDLKAFAKNYPNAWKELSTNGEMWQLYQSLGGVNSTFLDYSNDVKAVHEGTGKMIAKMPINTLETVNMTLEQIPRFTEFLATVEKGGTGYDNLMQAMYNAAEVTVNFGRGGTWSRNLSRYAVPFFNAAMQGTSRPIRRGADIETFKQGLGLATRAALLGIAPRMLAEMMFGDDEEYQTMNDRDKDNNYVIHVGENPEDWVGIPRGRVLSVISGLTGRAIEEIRGGDADWGGLWDTAKENVAPSNPIENNFASMVSRVDLGDDDSAGKTWWGGDIESRGDQTKNRPSQRYDSSTDELSKWLGEKTGKSPKKINNLIDSFSGVIGDIVLPALTPQAEQNIFSNAFTINTNYNNSNSGEFYDLLDEYNWDKNDKEGDAEGKEMAGITSKYLNKQSRAISDLNKEIEEISANSDYSDKTKRQKIDELTGQINEIKRESIDTADKYTEAVESVFDDSLKLAETYAEREIARIKRSESYAIEEKPQLIADVEAKIQDNATDIAYAEANREIFGAEYALETYNKDVYSEAKEANDEKGVDFDTYYDMYFAQKGYTTKKDRMMAMLDVGDLSTADKLAAADQIADSSDKFIDGFATSISKGVEKEFILAYDRRWSKRDKKREVLSFIYSLGLNTNDTNWLINTIY